ncbi:hypothetical protein WICMUC_004441 [Wickerhamomyces mucosus]|uniref:RING-type E3 ubiquitin transferase n=1 Tax=Wickerhamomyces mucosus TaxID=1378264 RepID=A0A9P8TBG2_9ASCO|nr:hypothetical protein WICMUC_004441 [Wickerhamomyces mucosus]
MQYKPGGIAHQKDSYFESEIRSKLQEAIQVFTGQRFIHTHPEELTVLAKALYLSVTTLLGSRTLGEEYADLFYVSRNGRSIPKLAQRIGFIISYTILPYFITRILRKLFGPKYVNDGEANDNKAKSWRSVIAGASYTAVLDSIMNIHLALFYLKGSYYSFSKRIFGMRYAFGHSLNKNEGVSNGGYEFLGGLILAQLIFKGFKLMTEIYSPQDEEEFSEKEIKRTGRLTSIPNHHSETIDLSNPKLLPYIPEQSRQCMLCLSPMKDPSCASCGHFFCWSCIADWARENPECPLCRQSLSEQSLLPLR